MVKKKSWELIKGSENWFQQRKGLFVGIVERLHEHVG